MQATTAKSAYWKGFRAGAPFLLVAFPFAMLFGVVAVEAGLHLAQVMGFSVLVIAGAAQYAALQLMIEDTAIGLVLLAALAVNMRMAMYSASLVPHLGAAPLWQRALVSYVNFDQCYMLSIVQYEDEPNWPVDQKIAFFLGVASPLVPVWLGATVVGAVLGSALPPEFALDFLVPILFLSLVTPALKTLAHVAAALTSAAMALALYWMPSGTGLLIAAFSAMCVGAAIETWRDSK